MQKIVPHLWFEKDAKGAAEFYVSVFNGNPAKTKSAAVKTVALIENTPSGTVDTVVFALEGQEFMAIGAGPLFKFNESISFIVKCDAQDEIDYYWAKLSAVPEAEQCGWLKDKYGVSWQIVPTVMDTMMGTSDKAALGRVTEAFLKMKKFNIALLEKAYNNA